MLNHESEQEGEDLTPQAKQPAFLMNPDPRERLRDFMCLCDRALVNKPMGKLWGFLFVFKHMV